MNEKSLRVLEFNKIIDKLKTKASSSLGLKHIENLKPTNIYIYVIFYNINIVLHNISLLMKKHLS